MYFLFHCSTNVCWCNRTSQVWVMTRFVVAKEVRESSFHFISPIIPPAVRLRLSDERYKSLLYKHLQSSQKWGCAATPRWQDFEWTLERVRFFPVSHQTDQMCVVLSTQGTSSSCELLQTHTQQTGRIRQSHDDVERAFTFQARIEKRLHVWPAIIFTVRL